MSINLLPPNVRENILYARRNRQLLRWSVALLFGIAGIIAVVVFGYFYINQSTENISQQVEQGKAELRAQKLEETQAQVEELSGNLKLVTQVLSKQILFSQLLQQTGSAMPAGSTLANLTINKLQGGIDLQAAAKDYQTATQVQINLQDPRNKIFEKVDIVNITCSDRNRGNYPCNGTYRALFAKDNPFAFISPKTTNGGGQ